jgi:hypothetical protein
MNFFHEHKTEMIIFIYMFSFYICLEYYIFVFFVFFLFMDLSWILVFFAVHKIIHTDIKKFLSYGLLHITIALKGLKFCDNGIKGVTILTAN